MIWLSVGAPSMVAPCRNGQRREGIAPVARLHLLFGIQLRGAGSYLVWDFTRHDSPISWGLVAVDDRILIPGSLIILNARFFDTSRGQSGREGMGAISPADPAGGRQRVQLRPGTRRTLDLRDQPLEFVAIHHGHGPKLLPAR